MSRGIAGGALALVLAGAAGPALAQAAASPPTVPSPAVGVEVYNSSDADHTDITKVAVNLDVRHAGPDQYQGLRLETAWFRPLGQATTEQLRVYYRFADSAGGWTWNGDAGTDGRSLIGAFDIHDEAPFRQEYFLERDIVETRQGLSHGLYYTFAGGALDAPIDAGDTLNLLGAVQDFTGDNTRLHLRSTYVHVLDSSWGLSAQLRARVFYSSHPGEFDYFSPRWYGQAMPVLQLRRFQSGWRYVAAVGVGAQRQTGGAWHSARMLNLQVVSPPAKAGWALKGAFTYSNTPTGAGYTYDYRELSLGVTRTF